MGVAQLQFQCGLSLGDFPAQHGHGVFHRRVDRNRFHRVFIKPGKIAQVANRFDRMEVVHGAVEQRAAALGNLVNVGFDFLIGNVAGKLAVIS